MKKILSILLLSAVPVAALATETHGHSNHFAAGQAGDASKVSQTIKIDMNDRMRFTPSEISVNTGDTVQFIITNSGKVPHEMVIGSVKELKEHAEMMSKMPNMQHDDPNMISFNSGKRGELIWQFTEAGVVDFACLLPGHMEAGMVGKVEVK